MKKLGILTFMVLSLVHCKEEEEEEVDPLLATIEILEHKEIIDPDKEGNRSTRRVIATVKNNHSIKLDRISLVAKWYYPNGEVEGSSGWGTEFGIDPGQTAEINIDAVFIPEAVVRYAVEIEFYAFEE